MQINLHNQHSGGKMDLLIILFVIWVRLDKITVEVWL